MPSRILFWLWLLTVLAISCCILPQIVFRVAVGSYPVGDPNRYRLTEGMTKDEVQAVMGRAPHERRKKGAKEIWTYYCDALSIGIWQMEFDEDGLLESDWW